MKFRILVLLGAALLLGAASCADSGRETSETGATPVPPEVIRGHYLFGHEVRALRPCDQDEDLWVIDRTGRLSQLYEQLTDQLQGDVRISVFAAGKFGPPPTEGFGADYPGAVIIDEVMFAALEGFGCDFDLNGFIYLAYGNEPSWMVKVLPGEMKLSHPGRPDVTWPGISVVSQGDLLEVQGVGGESSGILTIAPGPRYDGMSGAFYHLQARFDLGGTIFQGPALRGLAPPGEKFPQ